MRPSLTSSVSVIRAVSRRTGSKQDSSTDSGVSSIITLTPVTCSKARMLRPSRPMIRPFMSSPGRCTADTTDSEVCSDATRWMAPTTIICARAAASRADWRSMSRATSTACRLASCSTAATNSALACSAVRPAIRSRVERCSASISANVLRWLFRSVLASSRCRIFSSSPRTSTSNRSSRSESRCSRRSSSARCSRSSARCARVSSATSLRTVWASDIKVSALSRSSVSSTSVLACRSATRSWSAIDPAPEPTVATADGASVAEPARDAVGFDPLPRRPPRHGLGRVEDDDGGDHNRQHQ